MNSIQQSAAQFFDACETGKGWAGCSQYCHPDASFSAQADTFDGVTTLEQYTEAMRGLLTGPIPDGTYEMKAFAVDEDRNIVVGFAVFKGTNTGEGGPPTPTGNTVESDYVYVMQFDGGLISDMTKIWNDVFAMRQLGWN